MEELLKLAGEFSNQMVSCMDTKNNITPDTPMNKMYWAGKEQAWYEALSAINSAMKEIENGKGD